MLNSKSIRGLALLVGVVLNLAAAFGQPTTPSSPPQGLLTRLVQIKYTAELYLSTAIKQAGNNDAGKDSALANYNTLRWKVDGFVYQLSGDMVAANSPRKMRLLNDWCVGQAAELNNYKPAKRTIRNYTKTLYEIDALCRATILVQYYNNPKTLNLTTNVFYLLKDSYSIIKGVSDIKTQKTMALIELLDHTRLLSPGEVAKLGK